MPKRARSARGEMVDFDLLKIKQQIASAPKTTDVKKREDFIDKKLRRRVKKIKKKVTDEVAATEENTNTETTEDKK